MTIVTSNADDTARPTVTDVEYTSGKTVKIKFQNQLITLVRLI